MSDALNCDCRCPSPAIVEVPGTEGDQGSAGTNGTDGASAFTYSDGIAGPFNKSDAGITLTVLDGTPFFVGAPVVIEDAGAAGTSPGYFTVTATSLHQLTLTYLNVSSNTNASSVASGKLITIGNPTAAGALPNAITDNSTGTPSDTIAAGAGVEIFPFFVNLAQITATTIMSFTPGFAFKVLAIQFTVEVAVTTAAKLVTLTPQIGGVSTTGGALALTSANCTPKGTTVTGSAVTAANTGTNAQTLSLLASGVTAFVEGSGWVILKVQNMDTANAIASLSTHVNTLRTALA